MRKPVRADTSCQDGTMDEKEVVSAVLANLSEKVGGERFELWFGEHVRLSVGDSTLLIEVPSQFHQTWLRQNFRGEIEAVCQAVLGRALALEFRVVDALGGKQSKPAPTDRQCRFEFHEEEASPAAPKSAAADRERPPKRLNGASGEHSIPPGRKYATLESFVVGSTNRMAHAAAELAALHPGRVNPLFICGPTGVGKTHLLEAVLSEARARHRNLNAALLTAEQFTSNFLQALRGTGLPNFRHKHRGFDLLILDDIQFLVGKRATIIEFLHMLDTFVQHGRQIVVAADRVPAELHELGPEVTTRLASGMVARIDPADHPTRVGIVRRRAAMLNLELDEQVQELLATHLTSHARELAGAIHQLLAISRIRKEPITRAIAEEALADMIQQRARPIRLNEIDKAVCDVFGLSPSSLQASRRAKALNAPRMLAMWLARKHTRAALSEIGEYFGRRSHSTVISAHKAVGKWVAQQSEVALADKLCNVEDAIRRVEAKLRAG
jgi:chromosomal replication initiator protein